MPPCVAKSWCLCGEFCQEGQKKGWKEGSQEASEDVKGCEELLGWKNKTKQNKIVRKIDGARRDSREGRIKG